MRRLDKVAPRYGAKGLIAKIYESGSAKAQHTGNIDCFISPVSVIGRKNVAFLKEIYIGKLTKKFRDTVSSMLANSKVKTEDVIKFILDYYKLMCSPRTYSSVEKKFNALTPKNAKSMLESGDMNLCTIIEPFFDISFETIKTAAKMLRVELDEYVTIKTPDGKTIKTDKPVPVGITYMQFLEHFSSQYTSIGGAVKYSPITRQPMKIGGGGNVSTLGPLDINAFLTYEANDILNELLMARCDHHRLKRKMYSEIANSGELFEMTQEDIKSDQVGGTSELKTIYLETMGLIVR